jgi:hypothetical protein
VDLEPAQQRFGVVEAETLDDFQVLVPAEVAAGAPVEAAVVVEVRADDDEGVRLPAPDQRNVRTR